MTDFDLIAAWALVAAGAAALVFLLMRPLAGRDLNPGE